MRKPHKRQRVTPEEEDTEASDRDASGQTREECNPLAIPLAELFSKPIASWQPEDFALQASSSSGEDSEDMDLPARSWHVALLWALSSSARLLHWIGPAQRADAADLLRSPAGCTLLRKNVTKEGEGIEAASSLRDSGGEAFAWCGKCRLKLLRDFSDAAKFLPDDPAAVTLSDAEEPLPQVG